MENIIIQRTKDQKDAINTVNKNLHIIACAGSGKTDTVVQRIIKLIKDEKKQPKNIVAFTFTDKAGDELRNRIYLECKKEFRDITGYGLAEMFIGTIHKFCLELIQDNEYKYLKYTLLNEVQTKLFIEKTVDINGFFDIKDKNGKGLIRDGEYYDDIGMFLDIMNTLRESKVNMPMFEKIIKSYESTLDGDVAEKNKQILEQDKLKRYKYKYFDYTSVMLKAIELLKKPNINLQKRLNEIEYLVVDEYQDVNPLQEELIRLIYDNNVNICVVGDDDQTIYHWRGSKLDNIIKFSERYPNVEKIKLLENFRSSEGITELAYEVISHNKNRLDKKMKSARKQHYEKNDIIGKTFQSEEEEIETIIKKIKELKGIEFIDKNGTKGLDYSDMVILVYSVKNIPNKLLFELEKNEINFVVEGTKNLFETKEINAVVNIYKFLNGECKENELKKCWLDLNIGIEESKINYAISELSYYIPERCKAWEDFSLGEIYQNFTIDIDIRNLNKIKKCKKDILLYNLAKFTEVIDDFEKVNMKMNPSIKCNKFVYFLVKKAAKYYPEGWLSPNFENAKCLKIMTFFQAKGLEFPVVFMPFLTQGFMFPPKAPGRNKWLVIGESFPNKVSYESSIEDYRRLFYVGITRSKKFLFMSNSPHYYGNGTKAYRKTTPCFIEALNSDYVSQNVDYNFQDRERNQIQDGNKVSDLTLDFSTLSDFYECPNKFMNSYVYGFKQPLDYRMGYGKSIHNILTEIHKEYMNGKPVGDINVKQLVTEHFYAPYAPRKLEESMIIGAEKQIRDYVDEHKDSFKDIIYVEKKVEFYLDDGLFIEGRLDLVKNTKTRKTKIIDFKTKEEAQNAELNKEQLMIYAVGYYYLTGEKADEIEVYHLDSKRPTRFDVSDSDLYDTISNIKHAANCIHSGIYNKINTTIEGKEKCKKIECPYLSACNSGLQNVKREKRRKKSSIFV